MPAAQITRTDRQACVGTLGCVCGDVKQHHERGAHAQRCANRNAAHALDRHEEKPTGPVQGCDHAPATLAAPPGSPPLGVKRLGHEKVREVREEALCVGTAHCKKTGLVTRLVTSLALGLIG